VGIEVGSIVKRASSGTLKFNFFMFILNSITHLRILSRVIEIVSVQHLKTYEAT